MCTSAREDAAWRRRAGRPARRMASCHSQGASSKEKDAGFCRKMTFVNLLQCITVYLRAVFVFVVVVVATNSILFPL